MELSSCIMPTLIVDDVLENWEHIGSGGFGQIYKANHTTLGMDVAIKLLHGNNSSSSLQREADLMLHGGNPNVLRILGVYKGCPQGQGISPQFGLVMEYMERGSLAALERPPPLPLIFRISHQVALGMNFLHQLSPPLLHLDLKPSNVLLDHSLNAKITDFGLSKVAKSASRMAQESNGEIGGTTSYMPPEAFTAPYTPSFSFDVYSYGVLLWSVITGNEPYSDVISSLVRFRIPKGDRPDLASVDSSQAEVLKDLIECCWDPNPDKRPTFLDCVNDTKKFYDKHKREVPAAVQRVLQDLDDKISSKFSSLHVTPKLKNESRYPVRTKPPSASGPGDIPVSSVKEPELYTRPHSPKPPRPNPEQVFRLTPAGQRPPMAQRQHSTPSGVNIFLSNLDGVQIGNNNVMNINKPRESQRQRHRTEPTNVSSYRPSKYQQKQPTMKP